MNRKILSITGSTQIAWFTISSPSYYSARLWWRKNNSNWHTYARTENQHTPVIWMCSLECRGRLVERHPSSSEPLSPQCVSPIWSYTTCTNAHMYPFHLPQICCIPPHLSMWTLTGWQKVHTAFYLLKWSTDFGNISVSQNAYMCFNEARCYSHVGTI